MVASAQQQNVCTGNFVACTQKPKSDRDAESTNQFIIIKRNKHLLFRGAYNKVSTLAALKSEWVHDWPREWEIVVSVPLD